VNNFWILEASHLNTDGEIIIWINKHAPIFLEESRRTDDCVVYKVKLKEK
jgi:hypothetical protein